MTTDALVDAIGRVHDDLIQQTDALRQRKRRPAWPKWVALAACLCLVLSLSFPVFRHKGSVTEPVQAIAALEFNGAYYEAVRLPDILEKYGLPKEITADLAGEHLAYLQSDSGIGYEEAVGETDIELYTYAPNPVRAVHILRDGETWYAALFCNYRAFDDNTHVDFSEFYRVYGIESAEDIASVAEMDWRNDSVSGAMVTKMAALSAFYDLTLSLQSYGNADFQAMTFGGIPEENQPAAHIDFSDDCRNLRIETASGLRFFISVYPSYDWILGDGAMSYYRIDPPMHNWITENLG